ncbi:hypothetical protein CAP35_05390 [Chitinophagaceae bacterium IBVUCB1]|nr:hypothetical protein CAP35_05390 [Chitinophagaceae bacterium IBVUCB1]
MMKWLLPIVLVCLFASCSNNAEQQKAVENQNITTDTAAYYKRYDGTIAGQPVVLHLVKNSRLLTATYYYTKQGKPIDLYFMADSGIANGYLADEPTEQLDAQQQPQWKVVITGNTITGKWISADKQKTHEINLQEAYPAGSYQLTAWERNETIKLRTDKEEPAATCSYMLLRLKDKTNKDNVAFFDKLLLNEIVNDTTHKTIEESVEASIMAYGNGYKEEMKGEPDSNIGSWMNYASSSEMKVVMNDNDWIVFEMSSYGYTGGAHGNYGVSYMNIDMQQKRVWKMEDILLVDTTALQTLLEAEARKYYNMSANAKLEDNYLTDKILPNGNVFITHTGIAFVYNPYEIASYAQGIISLYIPYSKLQALLQPAFKQRMGL